MEQLKVSVIVPVYNVENYLRKCIDSIIYQTYEYMEIILIDDGSIDGSGDICDEYAVMDSRVKVIHKANGGLSDARNVGIDAATGMYIAFIDSDDFISVFFIELMLKALIENDADLSMVRREVAFWDGNQLDDEVPILKSTDESVKISVLNAHDALERMLYQDINTGAQFKFLKRNILGNIRFPLGCLYEDMATTYKMIQASKRIAVVDASIYAYRKRADSIIRQKYDSRKLAMLSIMKQAEEDILTFDATLERAFYSRAFSNIYSLFLQIPRKEKRTRNLLWKMIQRYRRGVLFDHSPYIRRKNKMGAFVAYFGRDTAYFLGRKFGQKGTMHR